MNLRAMEKRWWAQIPTKWLGAMKSEIGSMYQNKAWTLVDLPDDRQAIEINGSLRRRRTSTVILPSMKLDLWQRVFPQVQGVDYDETFSLVAMLRVCWNYISIIYEILQIGCQTLFPRRFS